MDNNQTTLWTKDFISITIINFFIFLSFQMIIATLPLHVENVGGNQNVIGLMTGLATISAFLIRPITGIALDRLGRRIVFIVGHIILIITTYFLGAYNIWLIIIIRFINGTGWGLSSTSSMTIASDTIPIKRFGEGVGLFNLSNGLGMALGPLIGLSILNASGFNYVVTLCAVLGIIALILSQFIKYKKIDKAKVEENRSKKFLPFEKESLRPSLLIAIITITYGSIIAFIPLYGVEQGIENIGLYFTIYAFFLMFIRPIAGKMIDKKGFDIFVYSGIIILILSMVILSRSTNIIIFIISAALYGIGFGLLESSLLTMAVTYAPEGKIGGANATFFACFDGGIGLGSIIAGLLASSVGYSRMYLLMAIPILIAGAFYKFTKKDNIKS